MYGAKIKAFRIMRGFSQDDMAARLNVTQATYSKIEGNKQKATQEQLETIAQELGVTIADITSNEPIVIMNQASNQGTQGIGHIENFYADQKELYEKMRKTGSVTKKTVVERIVERDWVCLIQIHLYKMAH